MYYIFLMHVLGFSSNSWVGNFYYSPLDNRIFKKVAEVVCGRKKVRKEKRTTWLSKEVKVAEKRQEIGIRGGYIQVKTVEAKEGYLKAKRAACHAVRNAKVRNGRKLVRHCREISNTIRGGFG